MNEIPQALRLDDNGSPLKDRIVSGKCRKEARGHVGCAQLRPLAAQEFREPGFRMMNKSHAVAEA